MSNNIEKKKSFRVLAGKITTGGKWWQNQVITVQGYILCKILWSEGDDEQGKYIGLGGKKRRKRGEREKIRQKGEETPPKFSSL